MTCQFDDSTLIDEYNTFITLHVPAKRHNKEDREYRTVPFPLKLYFILSIVSKYHFDHILSWQHHGKSFVIFDKDQFMLRFANRFFGFTKFASFRRQLNLYGFIRNTNKGSSDCGSYHQKQFARGQLEMCQAMVRMKGTKNKRQGVPKLINDHDSHDDDRDDFDDEPIRLDSIASMPQYLSSMYHNDIDRSMDDQITMDCESSTEHGNDTIIMTYPDQNPSIDTSPSFNTTSRLLYPYDSKVTELNISNEYIDTDCSFGGRASYNVQPNIDKYCHEAMVSTASKYDSLRSLMKLSSPRNNIDQPPRKKHRRYNAMSNCICCNTGIQPMKYVSSYDDNVDLYHKTTTNVTPCINRNINVHQRLAYNTNCINYNAKHFSTLQYVIQQSIQEMIDEEIQYQNIDSNHMHHPIHSSSGSSSNSHVNHYDRTNTHIRNTIIDRNKQMYDHHPPADNVVIENNNNNTTSMDISPRCTNMEQSPSLLLPVSSSQLPIRQGSMLNRQHQSYKNSSNMNNCSFYDLTQEHNETSYDRYNNKHTTKNNEPIPKSPSSISLLLSNDEEYNHNHPERGSTTILDHNDDDHPTSTNNNTIMHHRTTNSSTTTTSRMIDSSSPSFLLPSSIDDFIW